MNRRTKMHDSNNQEGSLPDVFGKCLGMEGVNPQTIHIRSSKNTPKKDPRESEIISYATANLPLSGKLKANDRGFVYLDIADSYIYELSHFLETPGVAIPPYFDTIYGSGAHITVALNTEAHSEPLPEDLDEEIPFTITGCYFVEPENWPDMESVWFLTISAPRLSEIRINLGLPPKIEDHEFHITFAVKPRFLSIHDILSTNDQSIIIRNF